MKRWQKLGLGLLTVAAITSLAACGNASSKSGGDDFLYVFNGKGEIADPLKKVVEEYGKENNIKVKTYTLSVGTTNGNEVQTTEFSSKTPPTIFSSGTLTNWGPDSGDYMQDINKLDNAKLKKLADEIPDAETLCETKDDGLVEQGVEHARALERLLQALGDRVDAALLRHVLAEQQGFGIFAENIVQGLVDLDRQMPRRQFFRQLVRAAEYRQALVGEIGAARFHVHRVRMIRRQWRDDFGQIRVLGPPIGFGGGGETLFADRLIAIEQLLLRVDAGNQCDGSAAQQRIGGFDRHQFLDAAPFDLEIRAGVAHDARGAQVQERRPSRRAAVMDRARDAFVTGRQI